MRNIYKYNGSYLTRIAQRSIVCVIKTVAIASTVVIGNKFDFNDDQFVAATFKSRMSVRRTARSEKEISNMKKSYHVSTKFVFSSFFPVSSSPLPFSVALTVQRANFVVAIHVWFLK